MKYILNCAEYWTRKCKGEILLPSMAIHNAPKLMEMVQPHAHTRSATCPKTSLHSGLIYHSSCWLFFFLDLKRT